MTVHLPVTVPPQAVTLEVAVQDMPLDPPEEPPDVPPLEVPPLPVLELPPLLVLELPPLPEPVLPPLLVLELPPLPVLEVPPLPGLVAGLDELHEAVRATAAIMNNLPQWARMNCSLRGGKGAFTENSCGYEGFVTRLVWR